MERNIVKEWSHKVKGSTEQCQKDNTKRRPSDPGAKHIHFGKIYQLAFFHRAPKLHTSQEWV